MRGTRKGLTVSTLRGVAFRLGWIHTTNELEHRAKSVMNDPYSMWNARLLRLLLQMDPKLTRAVPVDVRRK